MGNKFIFKEPLESGLYYPDIDIIPIFISNQNKESNEEMINRLNHKRNTLSKMKASYFSKNEDFFSSSIQEVESEMIRYKHNLENIKNNDYKGFQELLSIINNNRTNPKLISMQNISLSDYKNMNNETKKIILDGIIENRHVIVPKLFPSNVEQINLFKTFIGNHNIPDSRAISYFDPFNPKVILAAEQYFKDKYKLDYLTLYYYYPTKNDGPKMHRFNFVTNISKLFMAAQNDYISVTNPRLILENGKEIVNNNRYKCIGAMNLSNNTKIKVLKR
jgi:hypothetical protein